MPLSLTQNTYAIVPGMIASFLGVGGVEPYTYSVRTGGAGGTVDAATGEYEAPPVMRETPQRLFDTVVVRDDDGDQATARIMIATPLFLFCEILEREMGLAQGRVYLWDQKIFQPTDDGLYIAVSMPSCKPFANTIKPGVDGWDTAVQSVNMLATLELDIMSRGPSARDRKEEVVLAFNSIYAQSQQEANAFYIGKLPPSGGFVNLSAIDGAAIPYRFRISVNLQYTFAKTKNVPFFDDFEENEIVTNP